MTHTKKCLEFCDLVEHLLSLTACLPAARHKPDFPQELGRTEGQVINAIASLRTAAALAGPGEGGSMERALQVVDEVDRLFESSERLRIGRWLLPDERRQTIARVIARALDEARPEPSREQIAEALSDIHRMASSYSVRDMRDHLEQIKERSRAVLALLQREGA